MVLKNQLQKIKENWLLLVLVVVILVVFSGINDVQFSSINEKQTAIGEAAVLGATRSSLIPSYDSFAPEAEQRFITKTASLSAEIKRGTFHEADSNVKSLVKGFDGIIINENQNRYGEGKQSYLSSSYTIKVETSKYDSLLSQLKGVGEVTSFNENADDITEQKLDLETALEAEKARLERFNQLLDEASSTQEKIDLTDRIFNQERTIMYYEEALNDIDKRVSYSTIYFSITEKRSDFADAAFITLSRVVRSFVESLNSLIELIFVVIPWAIALLVIWLVYRKFKN